MSWRLALALAAALGAAGPALAQSTTNIAPPPDRFAVSPGGVDMRSARYVYSQTDLAIGGDAGLTLTRSMVQQVAGHDNPFANLSHNWDILLTEKRVHILQGEFRHTPGQPDYQIEIAYGGRSETFRGSGGQTWFEQTSRTGYAVLTYTGDRATSAVYTLQTSDGALAVFRPINSADCSTALRCAYVSQITQPDGTVLTFQYDNDGVPNRSRLRRVTSNRGYALLFEYGGLLVAKACVINLTLTTAPANNVCPANAQATATYTYGSFGGQTRLATVTDPSGATWSFTGGANTIGFVNPGESAPWLTNGFYGRQNDDGLVEEIVGSQQFADGTSYGYGWDEAPLVPGHVPQIAGGSFVDRLGNETVVRYGFPRKPDPDGGYGNVGDDGGLTDIIWQITPGPAEVTDPLGRTTTTDYCDPTAMANLPGPQRCIVAPLAHAVTDAEGIRTELTWDFTARNLTQVRQIAEPGSGLPDIVRSATYNCAPANFRFCNKPTSVTDARGNTTDMTYAAAHGGILTETGPAVPVRQPGGSVVNIRPQTRYEYAQRFAWISNGAGGYVQAASPVWLPVRTRSCRLTAASGSSCAGAAADEVVTDFDYGPNSGPNNLLLRGQTVTSIDGGVTTTLRTCYRYDALGRRIGETQPGANLASCPASQAAAEAWTANSRYDGMGRVTGTIAPDPDGAGPLRHAAVRNSYDGAGRLIRVEHGELASWQGESVAPASWSGFTVFRRLDTSYDAMSRKTRDQLREGSAGAIRSVTQYGYDSLGRLECTAVRMNPAIFGSLPASACTPGAQGTPPNDYGPDRIARNLYDAAGQRLQLREGIGTGWEAAEATWAYNLNGQVTTVIDGNGNRAELRYDGHGRQDRWTFPSTTRPGAYDDSTPASALASAGSVNPADYEGYGYDPNGNRTSLRTRANETLAFNYDALNRMSVKDRPGAEPDIAYHYDLRGLQVRAAFTASGEAVAHDYDGFGRIRAATTTMGGTARTLSFLYDRNGNRTRITHPDASYFSYEYDQLNRATFVREQGTTAIATFAYNAQGLRQSLARPNGTASTYAYDALGRLTSLTLDLAGTANDHTITLTYNPASGIHSRTGSNDAYAATSLAPNRSDTINGLNQVTVAPSAITWDARGNLTSGSWWGVRSFSYSSENLLTGAVIAGQARTLAYDPLMRLASGSAFGGFQYVYDPTGAQPRLVQSYSSLYGERRYAFGPGVDEPLVTYGGPGQRFFHADERGSIVAVTDSAGALVGINRYDEYGAIDGNVTDRFGYTGQMHLPDVGPGMWYYRARIYEPRLGRFMQRDPVGYDDQINLYAYVGNDPVNGSDPSGLEVVVTGGMSDRRAFVEIAEKATGLSLTLDSDTSLLTIDEIPENPSLAASELMRAVGLNERIPVVAVNNLSNIFYDGFDSGAVDVADLAAAQSADTKFGEALFTHIIAERYDQALTGAGYDAAHAYGISQESSYYGGYTRTLSFPAGATPGGTVTFQYRDISGNIVASQTLTLDNNLTPR